MRPHDSSLYCDYRHVRGGAFFIAKCGAPVAVTFLSRRFEASRAVVMLICVLAGVLIGGAVVSIWRLKRSIKKRKAAEHGPSDDTQRP